MPLPLLSPQAFGAQLSAKGSRQGGGRASRRQTLPLCPVLSVPICSWAGEQQTTVTGAQLYSVALAVSGTRLGGGWAHWERCSLLQTAVTQLSASHGAHPAPCLTAQGRRQTPTPEADMLASSHLVPPPENRPRGHPSPKRATHRRPVLPAPRPSPSRGRPAGGWPVSCSSGLGIKALGRHIPVRA